MLGTDNVDTTANGWLADDCDTASKPRRQQAVLLRVSTFRARPPAIPETRRGGRRRTLQTAARHRGSTHDEATLMRALLANRGVDVVAARRRVFGARPGTPGTVSSAVALTSREPVFGLKSPAAD